MGLDVTVGAFNAFEEDSEYLDYLRAEIEKTNRHLREVGLPEHREPKVLSSSETVSYQMWGYGGLHQLRRLGALLRLGLAPEPMAEGEDASESSELDAYYSLSDEVGLKVSKGRLQGWFGGKRTILFSSTAAVGPSFDHLVHHSDAEGFYLPVNFPSVVVAGAPGEAEYIGSSHALKRECEAIALAIALPLDLDPEDEEVLDAAESADPAAAGWKRFGVEAHGCLVRHSCASLSIEQDALLLYH